MSPKTGLDYKENNMEIKNQLSINNEKLNQNSTVDPIRLDNELKFKLNLNIRIEIITILNDYISLLYGDKNKENVIKKANDLMHNFVDLPLKIDQIKENVNNSSNNLLKPTLIINSRMKTEITDLLIKNKNYFNLFKDNKDIKSNLINENNNLVIKLMQFPIQMLKEDNPINNDNVWKRVSINESNHIADDHLTAKLEYEKEIANYKKEIFELKEKIPNSNALSTKRKESVTHFLEFGGIHYVIEIDDAKSMPFECLGLDFMIVLTSNDVNLFFELELINKLDINKKVRANCELILINNKNTSNKENMSLNFDLVYIQNKTFRTYKYVSREIADERFVNPNYVIKIRVNLTVELIKLED